MLAEGDLPMISIASGMADGDDGHGAKVNVPGLAKM
jgi:hypothetical protein